ncbi:hypothetical protein BDN70DRAFT_868529 [Pholiota conissans]|uniref:CxC5 like cysteine cluster associated with KDZ domain-containing protein n=1 Tax=Pholiota conissans TaxID=109636 RepID=A0A9P6CMZ5_9AGAR|nr:hypothetical protein BDN70DRAFT_868529 [Pholiota conissans]
MFHTLQVLAAHPELNNITALQLFCAFSLIFCLKRDITIPQPLSEAPECPPTFLPPAIAEFLAESLSISLDLMKDLWEIVREEAWVESQKDKPGKDDEECFRWKRELSTIHGLIIDSSITLYPLEGVCTNADCIKRGKTLKKTKFCEVVYTLAMGACRAYSAHLFCPDTLSNHGYHHNFSVCDGVQTYYGGMPKYLQVGEHQFVNDSCKKVWKRVGG